MNRKAGQRISLFSFIFLSLIFLSSESRLMAGSDWSLNDGKGEELSIKKPLFGKKSSVLKDRFNNSYSHERGLIGGESKTVKLLGNELSSKKGVFGNSQSEFSTIFGDKVKSKKSIFGRRKTSIDLSGSSAIVESLLKSKAAKSNP